MGHRIGYSSRRHYGRECLDFLIPFPEAHLRCILREWVSHYNHAVHINGSGRESRRRSCRLRSFLRAATRYLVITEQWPGESSKVYITNTACKKWLRRAWTDYLRASSTLSISTASGIIRARETSCSFQSRLTDPIFKRVECRQRIGGLLRDYSRAA